MLRFVIAAGVVSSLGFVPSQQAARANSQTPTAANLRIISVRDSHGELRGAFQTRPQAYRAGMALPLKVALPHQQNLKTEDGRAVNGFGFYAWDEGAITHLRIVVLIPAPGAPNQYLWANKNPAIQERDFAYYKLTMGEVRTVDEMKKLGMEPMRISLDSKIQK